MLRHILNFSSVSFNLWKHGKYSSYTQHRQSLDWPQGDIIVATADVSSVPSAVPRRCRSSSTTSASRLSWLSGWKSKILELGSDDCWIRRILSWTYSILGASLWCLRRPSYTRCGSGRKPFLMAFDPNMFWKARYLLWNAWWIIACIVEKLCISWDLWPLTPHVMLSQRVALLLHLFLWSDIFLRTLQCDSKIVILKYTHVKCTLHNPN